MKIHKLFFALLLVFALVIGLLPSVLAGNEPSTADSAVEMLAESQPEVSLAISPPTQSILESDEAVEDSEVEPEIEVPTSMDGETLTRMDNDGLMLLGGGGIPIPFYDLCSDPGQGAVAATLGDGVSHAGESLLVLQVIQKFIQRGYTGVIDDLRILRAE